MRVGGGPYTVPISIAGASRLSTVSMSITYNPAVLRVRSVQEGTFMRQGGITPTFTQQVDREARPHRHRRSRAPAIRPARRRRGCSRRFCSSRWRRAPASLTVSGVGTRGRAARAAPLQFAPAGSHGAIAMRRFTRERGYTFVELLVVTTIILILASAVQPLARVTIQRQQEAELRRVLREMRTAIDKFKDAADAGMIPPTELKAGSEGYPPDLETLVDGVSVANDATGRKLKFLRRVPIDPMTGDDEWGMRAYQDKPDTTQLGRTERLRRLLEERGHRARRHEVPGLGLGAS